jgi:hypothetical protein
MVTAPFVTHNVVQRWMQSVLVGDAAIVAAVGGAQHIFPNVSPRAITKRHLAHSFGGPNGGRVARPMRAAISQTGVFWDLTGWEPGYSQQALDPLLEAVMAELIGDDQRGTSRAFDDGDRTFTVDCDYVGPEVVPIETAPEGVWAPVRERYAVTLRPN